MTCLAAPVQIEGMPPCGEHFYFRSRHEILLAVGGEDPADAAPWKRQASYGPPGQEEASYLTAQPGLRLMLSLAAQHQSSCQHPGSNLADSEPSEEFRGVTTRR